MLKQLDPQSILFDALYPVGSYYETSDSTFNPNEQWSGTWEKEMEQTAMGSSASHVANTTGSNYYTGTMLTLFPKTKYLLLGRGSDNLGGTTTNVSQFYVSSGTAKLFREQTSQPTSNSGNTHVFTAYIETGDSAVGVGVASYDYSSGYTKAWAITAVPLNQREGSNRWHRIA
jgi:hypothetical protein